MNPMRKIVTASVLGLCLGFANAYAVETEESKSERAEEQSRKDTAEKKRPKRTRDDLDTCKRDAEGLKGPERSRFLTECLRDR